MYRFVLSLKLSVFLPPPPSLDPPSLHGAAFGLICLTRLLCFLQCSTRIRPGGSLETRRRAHTRRVEVNRKA